MKRKSRDRDGKSAIDILEEATHLLRANAAPPRALLFRQPALYPGTPLFLDRHEHRRQCLAALLPGLPGA